MQPSSNPQAQFAPVTEEDSDELVLERILENVERLGKVDVDSLIEGAELYRNQAAEKILSMAISDGMIRVEDEKAGTLAINQIGREIAQELRSSRGKS